MPDDNKETQEIKVESKDEPKVQEDSAEIEKLWTKLAPKLNSFFNNRFEREKVHFVSDKSEPKKEEPKKEISEQNSTLAELNALKEAFEKKNTELQEKEAKILEANKQKMLSQILKDNGLEDSDMQELAINLLGHKVKYDSEKEKFYLTIDEKATTMQEGIKKLLETDVKLAKLQKTSTLLKTKPIILKKDVKVQDQKAKEFGSQYKPFRIINGQKVYRD